MNESLPSTLFTGSGPQISVWIISSVAILRFAPFLICLTYFPLMQSMHCSMSENSNRGRMSFLTRLSILPLEIWPSLQCHNFDESRVCFLLFCSLFNKGTFSFTSHTENTFSCKDNKYNLSCKVATPTQISFNQMAQLPFPK